MYAKKTFSERLRALREAIGVTQEEFAKALNVSRPTISYYEKGDRTPDIDVLDRIHDLTGCSVEYLLGYVDNMKPDNAHIGLITELSDDAVEILKSNVIYSREINYIITHPFFKELLSAVNMYPHMRTSKEDDKSYIKFLATNAIGRIADDYYKEYIVENDPRFDGIGIYNPQSAKKTHVDLQQDLGTIEESMDRGTKAVYRFRLGMQASPASDKQGDLDG